MPATKTRRCSNDSLTRGIERVASFPPTGDLFRQTGRPKANASNLANALNIEQPPMRGTPMPKCHKCRKTHCRPNDWKPGIIRLQRCGQRPEKAREIFQQGSDGWCGGIPSTEVERRRTGLNGRSWVCQERPAQKMIHWARNSIRK